MRLTGDGRRVMSLSGVSMRYVSGGQSTAGAHRIETFNTCPRKWALRYAGREIEHGPRYPTTIGGVREMYGEEIRTSPGGDEADPVGVPRISSYGNIVDTGEPLILGTLYHAMLQHHYLRMRARVKGDDTEADAIMDPLSALWECARRGEIEQPHAAWQPLAARLAGYGALDPYMDRWGEVEQDWQILGVECEFSTELAVPPDMLPSMTQDRYLFTQRADLVVRSKATNRVYIVDHKCLPAGTLVDTELGARPIETIKAGERVAAWHDGVLTWAPAERCDPDADQRIFRIVTRTGRVIRTGMTHPFLVDGTWITAGELAVGDRLTLAVPPTGGPYSIDPAWLTLIPLLISDGGLTRDDSLIFTKGDARIRQVFSDAAHAVGWETAHREYGDKTPGAMIRRPVAARKVLSNLDVPLVHSPERYCPGWFDRLDGAQTAAVLRAFWMGDGCIRRRGTTVDVVYATRSRRLADDIQRLWWKLGVLTSVTNSPVKYKGEYRDYWFCNVLGLQSKRAALTVLAADFCGYDAAAHLTYVGTRPHVNSDKRNPEVIDGVYRDEIISITEDGAERCYNLTVRGPQTFAVHGGIVTHNTTGRYYPGTVNRYALSMQRLGYNLHGQRTYGGRYGGTIYNFIQFPNESARSPLGWRFERPEMPEIHLNESHLIRTILDVERRIEVARRANGGKLPLDPMLWPGVFRSGEPCVGIRAESNCALYAQCSAGTMDVETLPDFTITTD